MGAVGAGGDNRANTAHTRPPGFDPASCHLCGRRLRDHAVNEFCRIPPADRPKPASVPVRREFHMSTTSGSWVDQAAKDLKLDTHRACSMCKGKGTVPKPPTRSAISKAIGHRNVSAAALGKALADPPLSRLQTLAETLGGVSLEEAAAWCKTLAKRIEAEG